MLLPPGAIPASEAIFDPICVAEVQQQNLVRAETAREGLFRGPDPKCSALERPLIQRQGPEWGTWALSLT